MFTGLAKAQNKTVTGKVTDGSNAPLAYVTVSIKGTTLGTLTKEDGTFSISVPPTATTLVFSAVGQQTKEVTIGSQSSINVSLSTGERTLDEVVIAYGTQKRTAFTGSASTVKGDLLENRPVTSFEKALQGQATGITVQSVSGQPGGNSTVRIRGVGSFTASSTPLYVLDGVAITEGDLTQAQTTSNVLNTLDPKDIETITVLKDATAAGLYGSRAANGVVMITTKKGKAGKSTISFTANNGWSKIAVDRHDVMSGQEYYKFWFDHFYRGRIAAGVTPDNAARIANDSVYISLGRQKFYNKRQPLGADGQLVDGAFALHNTDWRDAILNTGRTQEYSMNVAGGTDKTRFYLSGSYFDQKGIVLASSFKRYSAKLNLEHSATSFLKVGANTTFAYTDQNTPAGAGGAANPIRFAEQTANVFPLYQLTTDSTGNRVPDPSGGYLYDYNNPISKDYNPVGLGKKNVYQAATVRGIVSGFAEATFLKDFRLKSLATADYIDILETQYYNPVHGDGAAVGGRTYKFRPRDIALTITNTLTYSHQFGKHGVDVLLGQEAVKQRYENIYTMGTKFPFDGIIELAAAATPVSSNSSITEKRISSLFSRANYNYDEKYFLTASLRRDGSSIFGEDKRYGTFWTVGGGWRIGREDFLSSASWVDELKLKASYGTAGNDNIGRYARLGLYSLTNSYDGAAGMSYSQLENTLLQWEQNDVLDIGVEFNFLSRFRAEFGYFTRWSKDVLFAKPLSYLTGFTSVNTNLATMKNYGVEGMIEATIFNNRNFIWTSSVNATVTKNRIQSMTIDSILNGNQRWKVGQDRYMWYTRKWAGVDPADGRPMWYADEVVNGAPTGKQITTKTYAQATRYDVGSALPKFFGGFNNTFSYKGIDLSILTYFNVGGKIYDANLALLEHSGVPGTQLASAMKGIWTTPGQNADLPRFSYQNTDQADQHSTRFLFDGSYVRLKNVTLGYNLPKSIVSKARMTNARIYIAGENFATWAKHKGMDPEVAIDGTTANDVPNIKTFTVGVNIGF